MLDQSGLARADVAATLDAAMGTRAGRFEGEVFIAMESIEGAKILDAWLDGGPRGWREVCERLAGAGLGLRDFKHENVMVGPDESFESSPDARGA